MENEKMKKTDDPDYFRKYYQENRERLGGNLKRSREKNKRANAIKRLNTKTYKNLPHFLISKLGIVLNPETHLYE